MTSARQFFFFVFYDIYHIFYILWKKKKLFYASMLFSHIENIVVFWNLFFKLWQLCMQVHQCQVRIQATNQNTQTQNNYFYNNSRAVIEPTTGVSEAMVYTARPTVESIIFSNILALSLSYYCLESVCFIF